MHSSISSKLSLYDILAMLIPGAFIICWVDITYCNQRIIDSFTREWLTGMLFIAVCYLVGIIYCRAVEWLWGNVLESIKDKSNVIKALCRNDSDTIIKEFRKVFGDISTRSPNDLFLKMISCLDNKKEEAEDKNRERMIKDAYYEAYAFVSQNKYRDSIEVLENQIAFLRSMFFIILLYFIFPIRGIISMLIIKTEDFFNIFIEVSMICMILDYFLLGLICIVPFIMASMQKKIYHIVWEDYEYLRRVKDDK